RTTPDERGPRSRRDASVRTTTGLADRLRARGRELGFEEVAFAPAGPAPRAEAFRRWLDRGYAGQMTWMGSDPEGRIDPRRRSPWARTIVTAAMSYAPPTGDVGE